LSLTPPSTNEPEQEGGSQRTNGAPGEFMTVEGDAQERQSEAEEGKTEPEMSHRRIYITAPSLLEERCDRLAEIWSAPRYRVDSGAEGNPVCQRSGVELVE
jgi:hypothetical protein